MYDAQKVRRLLEARKPGFTLSREMYSDADVFAFDCEAVWTRSWLMACVEAELPQAGSYVATRAAGSPILVVRDRKGDIRAFHNSCRHRGAQICGEGRGKAGRLVCPYHRWTYDLTGALLPPPRMGPDFDASLYGLTPIACETLEGLIYVCLSDTPPDFSAFRRTVGPLLAPHNLAKAKVAAEQTLIEKGNWKLVMENARECYHCVTGHPELSRGFPVSTGVAFDFSDDPRFAAFAERMGRIGLPIGPADGPWWQAARFPLNEGFISLSETGAQLVAKPLNAAGESDIGSLRWALEPNVFCHAVGDHAFLFSCDPISPQETLVTGKWLVHPEAEEGVDYDVAALTDLWTRTNLQDRDLVETNQRGVNSLGFQPGPYSPEAEILVARFVDWYCEAAKAALDAPPQTSATLRGVA